MASRPKALVVDDEDGVRGLLESLLSDLGADVVVAADGVEAIERLKTEPFGIVIADLLMPRADGIAVARSARTLYPKALVLMMSAAWTPDARAAAKEVPCDGTFTKPFTIDEVVRAVEPYLSATA
ncbi:MAG: response regulator [Planctomycetes bacterium]|nr:response regulator [Planctomycetota bacterium]